MLPDTSHSLLFILCHSEKSYDKSCLCSINDVIKISQYF